mgnify:FL=1
MGKLTDDMTRLVDEIHTMDESRCNFIKGIQNAVKQEADETRQFIKEVRSEFIGGIQDVVKQKADETRQFLKEFRNEMDGAHEAFFGTKSSFGGKPSRKKKTVQEM